MADRVTAAPAAPDAAPQRRLGTTEAALLALTDAPLDTVRQRLVELVAERSGAPAVALLEVAPPGRRPAVLAQVGLGEHPDLLVTPEDGELAAAAQTTVLVRRRRAGAVAELLRSQGLGVAETAGLGPYGFEQVLLASRPPGRRSEAARTLLRGVAAALAGAERKHRLARVAERRLRQHASVAELGQMALGSDDLLGLAQAACGATAANLQATMAAVAERCADGLLVRAGVGLAGGLRIGSELPLERTFSARVMRSGEALLVNDTDASPEFRSTFLGDVFRGGSVLVVPIQSGQRATGTLTVVSPRPDAYTEDDVSFVRSVANVVALAAERARVRGQLRLSVEELRKSAEDRSRLLAHVVQAQEDERRRIADDIHDDSVQVMTAVALRLATLRRRLGADRVDPLLLNLEHDVRQSISRLRHLMFVLRPPALENHGIEAALHAFLAQITDEEALTYAIDDRLSAEPEADARIVIYRIAQEAVANVCKHARASRVDVTLEESAGDVIVTIADDGVGFDPGRPQAAPPGHLGLMVMRERAEQSGGWCSVESVPGRGTTVRYCVRGTAPRPQPSARPAAVALR